MRVALIDFWFPNQITPYIWDWVREMRKFGLDVTVFASGPLDKLAAFNDAEMQKHIIYFNTHRSHFNNGLTPSQIFRQNLPSMLQNAAHPGEWLRAYKILRSLYSGRQWMRKLYELAPMIQQRFDIVHFNAALSYTRRRELINLFEPKTVVVSFRGEDLTYGVERYQQIFQHVPYFHFISEHLIEQAQTLGYEGGRHCLIPPMIDTEFYTPATTHTPGAGVTLFTAAKLSWRKGYEFMLQAVRVLVDRGYDIRYNIAGTGDFYEAVVYTIHELGLQDRVTMLGWLNPEQVRDQLQQSDIYVLFSVEEGFNNSVLQAQACAVPVVCSDEGGLPENIADGVTGLLAQRRDAWDLADKLEMLIQNAEQRKQMGEAGRKRAVEHFDLKQGAHKFIDFYQQIDAASKESTAYRAAVRNA